MLKPPPSLFPDPRTRAVLGIALISFAACSLMALNLSKGLWYDEYASLSLASDPNFLHRSSRYNAPPLYFLVLRGLMRVEMAEEFLRLFTVASGLATILVCGLLGRTYSPRAGWLAAALTATSPILVHWATEIRHYSLLLLATALSLYFARMTALRPSRRHYGGLGASLFLAIGTHAVGILVIPAALAFLWAERRGAIPLRRLLRILAVPGAVGAVLVVAIYWRHVDNPAWWYPTPTLSFTLATLGVLFGQGLANLVHPLLAFLLLAPLAATALIALLGRRDRAARSYLAAAAVYLGGLLAVSVLVKPVFLERTALPLLIPFFLYLAVRLADLPAPRLRLWGWRSAMATAALWFVAGVQILHYERYRPWYLVPMGIVKEMKRPGDLFAHYPVRGFQQGIGTYYTGFTPQELYRVPSCLSRALIGEDELREQLLLEQLKQTRKAHGRWGLFFFRWKDDHCWEEFGQYFYDRIRPHLGPPHHVFESERAHLLYFSSESRELAPSPGRRRLSSLPKSGDSL